MTLRCCIDSLNPPTRFRAFQRTGHTGRESPAAGWASPLAPPLGFRSPTITGVWQLIRFKA